MSRPSGIGVVAGVALRLRSARLALDKTQTDLAATLDIVPHRWSQWESGRTLPAMPVMIDFADRYGISLDWIFRGRADTMPAALSERVVDRYDDLLALAERARRTA